MWRNWITHILDCAKWYDHSVKLLGSFPPNIYQPYDSAVALLEIQFGDMRSYVHPETCTWNVHGNFFS